MHLWGALAIIGGVLIVPTIVTGVCTSLGYAESWDSAPIWRALLILFGSLCLFCFVTAPLVAVFLPNIGGQ